MYTQHAAAARPSVSRHSSSSEWEAADGGGRSAAISPLLLHVLWHEIHRVGFRPAHETQMRKFNDGCSALHLPSGKHFVTDLWWRYRGGLVVALPAGKTPRERRGECRVLDGRWDGFSHSLVEGNGWGAPLPVTDRKQEVAAVYEDLGLFRASTLVSRSVICGRDKHALWRKWTEEGLEHPPNSCDDAIPAPVYRWGKRTVFTPPVSRWSVSYPPLRAVPVTQTGISRRR